MNFEPLISIITPNYNMGKLLDQAISSIINQTYRNWELIIIDNFSDDNTKHVINKYKDNRIKFIQFRNCGVIGASRNQGIKYSSGRWIAFLDADDIWYPKRLEIFISQFYKKPYHDVYTTDEFLINLPHRQKKSLIYGRNLVKDVYRSLLIYGNHFSPSATIVSKDYIAKQKILFSENKNFITAEDYDFWLKIFRSGARCHSIRQFLGEFRLHSNNNSKNNSLHRKNIRNVIMCHIQSLDLDLEKKEKLRFDIETRLKLTNSKSLLARKDIFNFFKTLCMLFLNNPKFVSKYIILKLLIK